MELWLVGARLLLAAVFGVASVAKLADRKTTAQTLRNFGVPEPPIAALVWLLPLVELVTALALLSASFARRGALGALTLLLLFTIAIAANLWRGRTPACNCFGQLQAQPIGWRALTRNALLTLVAVFVIVWGTANPGADIYQLVTATPANLLAGASLGLLLAVVVLLARLLHQQRRLLERIEVLEERLAEEGIAARVREDLIAPKQHLPIGAPAPAFAATTLDGERVTLDDLLAANRPLLLVFVAPGCSMCAALLPQLADEERRDNARLSFALLSTGSVAENREKFAGRGIENILLQNDAEIAATYHPKWTPGALLISTDGSVASHIAYGTDEINKLLRHAIEREANSSAPPQPWTSSVVVPADARTLEAEAGVERLQLGDAVPAMWLRDLTDGEVDLRDYLDKPTLLISWGPNCKFCQAMLEELRLLEIHLQERLPQILLISTGVKEDLVSLRLQSTVLLDRDFLSGALFGAAGTPAGVLIDERGRIASTIGVGKAEILALAGVQAAELSATLSEDKAITK